MPKGLTKKGEEILSSMKKEYGPERGEEVFYASKNAGRIRGVCRGGDALDQDFATILCGGTGMGLSEWKVPKHPFKK